MMLGVFLVNSRWCTESAETYSRLEEENVARYTAEGRDFYAEESYGDKMCRLKSGVVTNLVVAFLFLTIARQIMIRMPKRN